MWGRKRGRLRRGRRRARGWVQEGRRRARTRGLALGAGPHLPGALGRSRTCCPRWSASSGAAMGDVCDTGGLVFFFFFGSFVFYGAAAGTPTTTSRTTLAGRAKAGVPGSFPWAFQGRGGWVFSLFVFSPGSITPLSTAGRYFS